jgi:hypothetical protein
MRRILVLAVLCGSAAPLAGQADTLVSVGRRVRVRTMGESGELNRRIEGIVVRMSPDTLVLRLPGSQPLHAVATDQDTQYSMHTGRRSSLGKGAVIGAITGIVVGGAGFAVAGADCPVEQALCFHRRQTALAGGALIGALGAAVGLAIGAFTSHDVWTPAERRSALVLIQTRSGIGLSIWF